MKKLNVVLVGYGPDTSSRVKAISYAPFALKAYLDINLPEPLKDKIQTQILDFQWYDILAVMTSRIIAIDPDVVGFSVYLWNYNQILECVRELKILRKEIFIVLGGPQVSPLAEKIMRENLSLDVVVFSTTSGEIVLLDIVKALSYGKNIDTVKGIFYRDPSGGIRKTDIADEEINYQLTPSPYFAGGDDLFSEDTEYMAVIESSRGCPYDCGYCFWNHGKRKIEYFPLERVLKDINAVYNNSKVKEVYFADSNLLADANRAEVIVRAIINQNSVAKSNFEINALCLTETMAKLMNSLPSYQFLLAVQSTNPNALKHIRGLRPYSQVFVDKIKKLKQWVPQANYRVDVMLGLPGDDFYGFIQTLDFVLSMEPVYIVLSYPIYLLPGSRFFENKDNLGLKYTLYPPFSIIETSTFPKKDIEKALRITIWVQILTFYYPAVARFFYDMAKSDGIRMQRLIRWIERIESKIDLFEPHGDLSDTAVLSLTAWNKLKKELLEKASVAESAYHIYSSIRDIEKQAGNDSVYNDINLGYNIFKYMNEYNIDAVGFDSYDSLPEGVTGDNDFPAIRGTFSRYKR